MKYYTEDHEWVEISGEEATVGISEYAADELGEITYVEPVSYTHLRAHET